MRLPRRSSPGSRARPGGARRKLLLEGFRPQAVVFDVDGTLVNNMPVHADAFAEFMARHHLPAMTMEDRARLDGKRNSEIFPVLFGRDLPPDEWRRYEDEKESLYRELSAGRLRELPGLTRLLDRLDAHGIHAVLATSAPEPNVVHTLRELGLDRFVARTVRGDQVPRGKPAPDVFLAAAQLAGVPPGACLAFEDAPMGVAAARGAGMRCVAVATSFGADTLMALPDAPDAVVRDFDEFLDGPGRWLLDGA